MTWNYDSLLPGCGADVVRAQQRWAKASAMPSSIKLCICTKPRNLDTATLGKNICNAKQHHFLHLHIAKGCGMSICFR